MCILLNGARRFLVGSSMSQCLLTQKVVVIIDIGILRSNYISHREIDTQRESNFRGSSPIEASTSGSGEIRLIIAVVAAECGINNIVVEVV